MPRAVMLLVWVVVLMFPAQVLAASLARPGAPKSVAALPANATGLEIVQGFMGVGYRDDGALDVDGRYTTFEPPRSIFSAPGFNCSGFTLAAWRYLTGQNVSLDAARADANGNSGPESPQGEDWDFGFDLLCNLAASLPGTAALAVLDGEGATAISLQDLQASDPMQRRGFPMADAVKWRGVAAQLSPGDLALVTVSKQVKRAPYTLLHYHVAILCADAAGRVWFMHATPKSGTHQFDIATKKGAAAVAREFQGNVGDKRALVARVRGE